MTALDAPRNVVIAAPETAFWTRARKAGLIYLVAGLLAALFWGVLGTHGATSHFTLGESTNGHQYGIPSRAGALGFGLLAAVAGVLLLSGRCNRWFGWLSGVAIVGLAAAFIIWQVTGTAIPLGSTAKLSVVAALPLVFGALAGVLGERSGVINVGIEGQFLVSAFLGALIGSIAHSAWSGLIAAVLGGVLVAALLAVMSIRYAVDQVVLGVIINLLAAGLTSFLYSQIMQTDQSKNSAPALPAWRVPLLYKIPIIGPALFEGTFLLYAAIVLVIVVTVALFHTRWGLRTRAVGEHPEAADTVGIKVLRTRYRNVLIAGALAGLGGAYFTIGVGNEFSKDMTQGRGFIALAALIFGRWSPIGATMAALLFGFSAQLAYTLGAIGSSIPAEFLNMLPYAVTIVAVAGLVGRVRAPAADGKPYTKG